MPSPSSVLKSQLYRAGAGAGKTTTLVAEVIRVATDFQAVHKKFPRLVVTTFTRKATQELRERLMRKAQESGDPDLLNFVLSRSCLQISTIHGVLGILFSRFGHRLGLDTEFRVIDENDNENLARRALKEIFRKEPQFQNLLERFTFSEATRILMNLSMQRVANPDSKPYGASELRETRREILNELAHSARVFADEILANTQQDSWKQWGQGLLSAATAPGEAKFQHLQVFLESRAPSYLKKNPPFSEDLSERLGEFRKEARARLESLELREDLIEEVAAVLSLLGQLCDEFHYRWSGLKSQQGWISMADLELSALETLRNHPLVAEGFSQEWDYWFIDEYQDTSPLQVQLIERLRGDRQSFIVGDPQQSIYYFRGARSEVFHQREQEFRSQGIEIGRLNTNYRSQPELIAFFNDLFRPLGFEPMKPRGDFSKSTPCVARVAWTPDEDSQKAAVARFVQTKMSEGVRADQIVVLGRTNKVLNELAGFLEEYGIPTHIHSAGGFYDRREVLDALALLKFLVHPFDDSNLAELLRSPYVRVADEQIVKFGQNRRGSLWSALVSNEDLPEGVTRLKVVRDDCEEIGITGAFEKALVEWGFVDLAHEHDVTGRREANLWKLVTQLRHEHHQPGFNYLEFIQKGVREISLADGGAESEAIACAEPERVNFMTIHQSKGLQFDHVIVPDMQKTPNVTRNHEVLVDEKNSRWSVAVRLGEPPTLKHLAPGIMLRKQIADAEEAESFRLLYVALTRAKESVLLTSSGDGREGSWKQQLTAPLATILANTENIYQIAFEEGPWPAPVKTTKNRFLKNVRPILYQSAPSLAESESATALVEARSGAKVPVAPSVERLARAAGGTLIHRILEAQNYLTGPAELDRLIQNQGISAPAEMRKIKKALDYLRTQKEVPFEALWKQGHAEWGFMVKSPLGQVIQGQVDLWGTVEGVTWIVDYKTGSPEYAEKAFQQLKIYSWALSHFQISTPVKLVAVFPLAEKIQVLDSPRPAEIVQDLGWI